MLVSRVRGLRDAYIGECPYFGEIHTGDFRMVRACCCCFLSFSGLTVWLVGF